tara:strand:- start:158 stop:748 length:591 start_codon:yes stop_codon:yes gene_type:complete
MADCTTFYKWKYPPWIQFSVPQFAYVTITWQLDVECVGVCPSKVGIMYDWDDGKCTSFFSTAMHQEIVHMKGVYNEYAGDREKRRKFDECTLLIRDGYFKGGIVECAEYAGIPLEEMTDPGKVDSFKPKDITKMDEYELAKCSCSYELKPKDDGLDIYRTRNDFRRSKVLDHKAAKAVKGHISTNDDSRFLFSPTR